MRNVYMLKIVPMLVKMMKNILSAYSIKKTNFFLITEYFTILQIECLISVINRKYYIFENHYVYLVILLSNVNVGKLY